MALHEQYILYNCNLNAVLLHKIFSLQLAPPESFALCCTSIFVFYMKVVQATLPLSAHNWAQPNLPAPQFCRWEWRIYHSVLTNIWIPPPVERPLYSPPLGFGEVLARSNPSSTLMAVNGVHHQKLNLAWKMSLDDPAARGHHCLESTQSSTTPPICLELGI